MSKPKTPLLPDLLPIGTTVYVDRCDEAIIKDRNYVGTYFFPFPHYKVDFADGRKNVVVEPYRIWLSRG